MNARHVVLPRYRQERGFVLVTSLIFLVVVTLLAVSAIRSSSSQEIMASNLREKARARQAADAALRQGERLLENTAFNTQPIPGNTVVLVKPEDSAPSQLKIWSKRQMFAGDVDTATNDEDNAVFLAQSTWENNNAAAYALPDQVRTQYYVEDWGWDPKGGDFNPESRTTCENGVIYRITARATGRKPSAVAITQSFYAKKY